MVKPDDVQIYRLNDNLDNECLIWSTKIIKITALSFSYLQMAVIRQSNDNASKTLLMTTIDKPCYYVKLLIKIKYWLAYLKSHNYISKIPLHS